MNAPDVSSLPLRETFADTEAIISAVHSEAGRVSRRQRAALGALRRAAPNLPEWKSGDNDSGGGFGNSNGYPSNNKNNNKNSTRSSCSSKHKELSPALSRLCVELSGYEAVCVSLGEQEQRACANVAELSAAVRANMAALDSTRTEHEQALFAYLSSDVCTVLPKRVLSTAHYTDIRRLLLAAGQGV